MPTTRRQRGDNDGESSPPAWEKEEALVREKAVKEHRTKTLAAAVQKHFDAQVLQTLSGNGSGVVPRDTIPNIIAELGNPPWLNRHTIYNEIKKYRKQQENLRKQQGPRSSTQRLCDEVPTVSQTVPSTGLGDSLSGTTISSLTTATVEPSGDVDETENVQEDHQQQQQSTSITTGKRSLGGRPEGSTKQNKLLKKQKVQQAKELAAIKLDNKRKAIASSRNDDPSVSKLLRKGEMEKLIVEAGFEVGFSPQSSLKLIPIRTIRNRVASGNLVGYKGSYSNTTPMADVEPALADLCRQLNRMGKSLYPKEFLRLAQSMIKGTPTEEKVAIFRKVVCGKEDESNNTVEKLSMKYFHSFMSRHKDILCSIPVAKKDVKRLTWASYENVEKMYSLVYEEMVKAGVAIRLDEECYFDKDGNKTLNAVEETVGLKTKYQLTHPDYVLFVDETGSNTNMTTDGKRGRSRCISEVDCPGTRAAIATDMHFTVLGFTAATGEPVCAVVIFTSEREESIPLNWISGIDIGLLAEDALRTAQEEGENLSDGDLVERVRGKGKPAGGGPVCTFKGKQVPCFVQWSPHGGITPTILTNCLRYMDSLDLFPRSSNLRPFVLLDGHHSRFDLQFLDYIRQEEHLWAVAFGLPYATCIWQVADSNEQNGSFKTALTIAKEKLLETKEQFKFPLTFAPTDIIPTLNYAWANSFARKDKNMKAICDRGWYPLAYQLLTDPKIVRLKESNCNDVQQQELPSTSTTAGAAPVNVGDNGQVTLNIGSGFVDTVMDMIVDSEYMKRRRRQNAQNNQTVRNMLDRTKKLSSGPCYAANIVALHSDACWEHQKEYYDIKNEAEVQKRNNSKIAHLKRKRIADEIRRKEQSTWTVDDISRLLTYKKNGRNDKSLASFGNNREVMLAEWERRKHRPTPQHSPIRELPRRLNALAPAGTVTADDNDVVDGLLLLGNEEDLGARVEI